MPLLLPITPSVPLQRFAILLGGVEYLLDFRWNARDAAWFMTVSGLDGKVVAASQKLIIGNMIGFRQVGVPAYPRGVFIVGDAGGERRDAGLDDITTRVQVVFYTYTEMAVFFAKLDGFIL